MKSTKTLEASPMSHRKQQHFAFKNRSKVDIIPSKSNKTDDLPHSHSFTHIHALIELERFDWYVLGVFLPWFDALKLSHQYMSPVNLAASKKQFLISCD